MPVDGRVRSGRLWRIVRRNGITLGFGLGRQLDG
jgi:hypothetical protein